jgi:hypothetical protein
MHERTSDAGPVMTPGALHARVCLAVATSCGGVCSVHAAAVPVDSVRPIFFIAKNDSRNEVHYSIAVRPNCQLSDQPVHVYWLRRADPTEAPRPLNVVEKLFAYGPRISRLEPNRVIFTLAADDSRPIIVDTLQDNGSCSVRARMRMLGEWVAPKSAHLEITDSRGMIPKVSHIDLHASGTDGAMVCERVTALRTPGTSCSKIK